MKKTAAWVALLVVFPSLASAEAAEPSKERLEEAIEAVMTQVIAWRRDIHQHPELSNREVRTAALVAEHLRSIGLDSVETGIAHTGVVGTLIGGRPGPVVALRADMDALPVREAVDVPFASTAVAEYNGRMVPVMHACGHDNHTAILMGVAQVLAGLRAQLPGTIRFIFQPAEEGAPEGEEGGSALMLREGVFEGKWRPAAIFGLHVFPFAPGTIGYREGAALAAADWLHITVRGRQTHGSAPWRGVDPITAAAQIIAALQTIPSRQMDLTRAPVVVSVGSFHGGVRGNIIPDSVELTGTIRTFDPTMQEDFHRRIRRTAEAVAEAAGATAEVTIEPYGPVTYNDPELTRRMLPTLSWASGDRVFETPPITGAEDFSFYANEVPGLFVLLGVNREGVAPDEAAPNHSPHFYANEDALVVGVRALAGLAWDFLNGQ